MSRLPLLPEDVTKLPCAEPSCAASAWLECRACWGTGYVHPDVRAATLKRIKEENHGAVHEGH